MKTSVASRTTFARKPGRDQQKIPPPLTISDCVTVKIGSRGTTCGETVLSQVLSSLARPDESSMNRLIDTRDLRLLMNGILHEFHRKLCNILVRSESRVPFLVRIVVNFYFKVKVKLSTFRWTLNKVRIYSYRDYWSEWCSDSRDYAHYGKSQISCS